jgi:hypothetical protein
MPNKRCLIFIAFIYILATTILYLRSFNFKDDLINLKFFYPDGKLVESIKTSIEQDPINTSRVATRVFHNKPLSYLQSALESVFKIIDPVILFTLTNKSAMYDPYIKNYLLLYPFELPLVIFCLIILILKMSENKKIINIKFNILFILSVLFIAGFKPDFNKIKLFPLILWVRLYISIILINFLLWKKH